MQTLIDWLQQLQLPANLWVIQLVLIILAASILNFIVRRVLDRTHKHLVTSRRVWDDAILDALRAPLRALIWIVAVAFVADMVRLKTDAVILSAIGPVRDIAIIMMVGWFFVRLVRRVERNMVNAPAEDQRGPDRTTVDALGKLARATVFVITGLMLLQTLGFSISGVLAFGGIGGLAIGLAAKDMLANFFGGLTLYLDRPFAIGDWIRSPDREIEGTVEYIGWRQTVIRTFDKRPLYVPNATFSSIAVENPSRMTHRRIYETIGIRNDDLAKMAAIIEDVKAMLRGHDEIDTTQTLIVNFNHFAPSSLDFFVYTFTKTTEWVHYHEVKQEVLLRIADIISAHGAETAYPTSTIHLATGAVPPALKP